MRGRHVLGNDIENSTEKVEVLVQFEIPGVKYELNFVQEP